MQRPELTVGAIYTRPLNIDFPMSFIASLVGIEHCGVFKGENTFIHINFKTKIVEECTVEEFSNGYLHLETLPVNILDHSKVVERALTKVGKPFPYEKVFYNCYHFAQWCVDETVNISWFTESVKAKIERFRTTKNSLLINVAMLALDRSIVESEVLHANNTIDGLVNPPDEETFENLLQILFERKAERLHKRSRKNE